MTNSPDPRSTRTPLGFDEFVGIFVALSAIGAILLWSLSRRNEGFQIPNIISLSPTPTAPSAVNPDPQATASPAPESLLLPLPVPAPSPEESLPVTPETTFRRQTPQIPAIIPLPAPTPAVTATPSTPAPSQTVRFLDVPENFWAYPFITALANRGIVNGFPGGYYKPTDPVTRAEFAALLQEAFANNPGRDNVTVFKDVPPTFWGVPAIDRAIQSGFLKGYPDNTFQPQQEIPKVQVLVALASGLNQAPPSSPQQALQSLYQDADQIPQYAIDKVAAASNAGLVVNYPDSKVLNPNQNATRAEVAAFIHQALVRSGRLQPIQSSYITGGRSQQ